MGEENGEIYHDMKLPGSLIYMDAPRPSSSEIRAVLNDALKK